MPSRDTKKYKTIKSCRITLFLWKPALAGEDSAFPSIDHVLLEEFAAPLELFLPVFILLNLLLVLVRNLLALFKQNFQLELQADKPPCLSF